MQFYSSDFLEIFRITRETLRDTEKRLNEELEMRALLTTELDNKEELKVTFYFFLNFFYMKAFVLQDFILSSSQSVIIFHAARY